MVDPLTPEPQKVPQSGRRLCSVPLVFAACLLSGLLVYCGIPYSPYLPDGPLWLFLRGAGAVLLAVGQLLLGWSFWSFLSLHNQSNKGKRPNGRGGLSTVFSPGELICTGAYRYSRNPMYASLVAILLGMAGLLLSPALLASSLILLQYLRHGPVPREERYLEQIFGDEYRRFCAGVRRWF